MSVSIIIPVYNVEKYLERCIKSAAEQTYNDLEIIIVDDGSTDESGNICDKWAKRDERIKVIHKKNGGLSSARNAAVKIATGDYVFFLDSDDYLASDCIEVLHAALQKSDTDIVIGKMVFVEEEENAEINLQNTDIVDIFQPAEAIEESLYQSRLSCSACAKLYKRVIVNMVAFPEGRISEDLATCHLFFDQASKIAYIDHACVYYRQRTTSIMHNFNVKRLDALYWAKEIESYCSQRYPNISKAARCRTFNVAVHLVLDLPEEGEVHDRYISCLRREIKRTRFNVLFDRKARMREKAAAVLSYGGERLMRNIWNSKLAVKRNTQ